MRDDYKDYSNFDFSKRELSPGESIIGGKHVTLRDGRKIYVPPHLRLTYDILENIMEQEAMKVKNKKNKKNNT